MPSDLVDERTTDVVESATKKQNRGYIPSQRLEAREITTVWYVYSQSPVSGAFFEPARAVLIEAHSVNNAATIAATMDIYLDGVEQGIDCPCCGDRWVLAAFGHSIEQALARIGGAPEAWEDVPGTVVRPRSGQTYIYQGNPHAPVQAQVDGLDAVPLPIPVS